MPQCVEAVRILKNAGLPCRVSAGLSNVSNAVPAANRPLLNRVYMVQLMAAGLDMAIADPLDHLLDKSAWLNFYHMNDLVSGSLDAYNVDANIECEYKADFPQAHLDYWAYDKMYLDIAGRFFK